MHLLCGYSGPGAPQHWRGLGKGEDRNQYPSFCVISIQAEDMLLLVAFAHLRAGFGLITNSDVIIMRFRSGQAWAHCRLVDRLPFSPK